MKTGDQMKNSKIMGLVSLISLLVAVGCASGDDSSATSASSSSSNTTSGPVSCSGTTLSGNYTGAVTVPASATCNFSGLVVIKSGGSLTIGAGATMKANPGQSPASSVIIDTGATIDAQGTSVSPIKFTSGNNVGSRAQQDWGGLVIRGRATHNFTTATFTTEFDDGGAVGSSNAANDTENSGTLKYIQLEFAGKQATSTKEYNGFTFEAVGSGTTVDYIHAHQVGDDAIEFFGGTVNVKHVISTAYGDDGFDWTYGWRGKAQFVIVNMTDGDSSNDSNGVEADNSDQPNGDTLTPKSSPTIYNMTLVSNNKQWKQIMRLRRGTQALFYNLYVGNWCDTILVEDTAGQGNVTTGNVAANTLKIQNALFEGISRQQSADRAACTGAGTTNKTSSGILDGATPANYDALLSAASVTVNAAVGNGFTTGNWASNPTDGTVFKPSAAITTNAATPPNDGFFDNTANFIGAVGGTDWTATWATYPAN
jgi:hypothetical protein